MAGAAIVAAALARGLMPMGVLRVREGRTPDVYARRKTAIKNRKTKNRNKKSLPK
jgi:hypothetical protein